MGDIVCIWWQSLKGQTQTQTAGAEGEGLITRGFNEHEEGGSLQIIWWVESVGLEVSACLERSFRKGSNRWFRYMRKAIVIVAGCKGVQIGRLFDLYVRIKHSLFENKS